MGELTYIDPIIGLALLVLVGAGAVLWRVTRNRPKDWFPAEVWVVVAILVLLHGAASCASTMGS